MRPIAAGLISLGLFAQTAVLDDFSQGIRQNGIPGNIWISVDGGPGGTIPNQVLSIVSGQLKAEAYDDVTTYTVTNAVNDGGNCGITTSAANPYVTADVVILASIGGATGCNGTSRVVPTSTTYFKAIDLTFSGTYTSGGTALRKSLGVDIQFSPYPYNPHPTWFVAGQLISGSWSSSFNKMRFRVQCDKNYTKQSGGVSDISVGTYVKRTDESPGTSSQGFHYYHFMNLNFYANKWFYVDIGSQPQATNFFTNFYWGYDPEWNQPNYANGKTHYWDGMTNFYIEIANPAATGANGDYFRNMACLFDDLTMSVVTGEPFSWVANTTSTYSGTAYEVNWWGVREISGGPSFEVRYSTSQSLKTLGFSNGTSDGTVTGPDNSVYGGTNWSLTTAEVANMWVGIRPTMYVLDVTGNGVSPIIVTTKLPHNLATGDHVTVASVGGNTNANVTANAVTVLTPGLWMRSDSTLTSIVVSSNVATATTNTAHGLTVGQRVRVWGDAVDADLNSQGLGYRITGTPTSTTLTFTTANVADGTYNGNELRMASLPAFSLDGTTGNGAYTSGGTVISTDNDRNFTEVLISSSGGGGGSAGGSVVSGKVVSAGKVVIQ